MKKLFSTRKGLILLAQVVIVLAIVSILLLSQIGTFAGQKEFSPASPNSTQEIAPTILTTTIAPEVTAPVEEAAPPPGEELNNGNFGQNGMTAANQACQAFHKSTTEAMQAANQQSTQLWSQIDNLRIAASATSDQSEALNLWAQADTLQLELDRVNNLNSQLSQDLMQGHRSFTCGNEGPIYGD